MILILLWLILFKYNTIHPPVTGYQMQSECVQSAVGNNEILSSKSFDLDNDGNLDTVVVYGGDNLNVLVVTNSSTSGCKIVLDKYLTFRQLVDGRQIVTIRNIELIEVTGDTQPEIHIWLEKRNGGPRQEVALHAIYSLEKGQWEEALLITECLAASSFEFKDEQSDGSKSIYLDNDTSCEWPWSSRRPYTIMKWNGSKFLPAESGTIEIPFWQTQPSWIDSICILLLIILIFFLVIIIWMVRKRKMAHSV